MKYHTMATLFVCLSVQTLFADGSFRKYDDRGRPNPEAFDSSGIALGLNAGTLGAGVEAGIRLTSWANLRVSGHVYSFSYKDSIDGIDYTFDMDMENIIAAFELYPGDRQVFKFVGGAVFSGNEIDVLGVPQATLDSRITGEVTYDKVAPYVGIGFGNALRADANFSISLDLGVIFQSYELVLKTEGTGSGLAWVDERRTDVEDDINDILEQIKIYPVATVSVAYQF